jgi:hypothetical protein
LKGTALLLSEVFDDIGERMIGDIDFIIQHKDEGKIKKVLEENKYCSKSTIWLFRFFKHRHLPKTTHKNKIIAVEPHLKLLDTRYRCAFNTKRLLNDFNEGLETVKTPSQSFLFDHCVYNFQINDQGFINSKYSHRSIYDIYKLDCKNSLTIKNIKKDIYTKHYFLIIDKFEIFDINITSTLLSSYFDKLIMLGRNILGKIYIRLIQIVELFVNYKYRKYAFNKIINFSNKKTS